MKNLFLMLSAYVILGGSFFLALDDTLKSKTIYACQQGDASACEVSK